jgi:molybdate transport system ATP-binding protein
LRCLLLDAGIGERIFLALSARDVLLAREAPRGLSARNLLPARVRSLTRQADRVLAELEFVGAPADGATVSVALSPEAREEISLSEGAEVHAIFKASALRAVTASGDNAEPGPIAP